MKQLPGWLSGAIIVFVAVGAVFFLAASTKPPAGSEGGGDPGMPVSPLVGKAAPALAGTTTAEKPFALAGYRSKVVLLNFWGTWCPPCVGEIPDLVALQKKYEGRGFTIVGLAENRDPRLTEAQYHAALQIYLTRHGMSYPNVPMPEGAKQAYQIEAFPTTFLLDKNGVVVYSTIGAVDPTSIAARIEKLL